MKLAAILLALLAGGAAIPGCQAQPPFPAIENFTGRIETADGSICSGTRYFNAVITSRHCLEGPGNQIRFQGILANITRVWIRGENIYVFTDRQWGAPPKFAKAIKGEPLYLIGNAGGFEQLARDARMSGALDVPSIAGRNNAIPGALLIACASCYHGDSGAGLFNAKGQLVGVYLGAFNQMAKEQSGYSFWSLSIAVPVL